jgi:plastocyanin
MPRRRVLLYAAGFEALLLGSVPASAAPGIYTVVIDKLRFGPVPQTLHKRDTIVWVNKDMLRHSATAADHSFDADLPPGAHAKTILKAAGTIPFVCRYHPGMRGTLSVK